MADFLLNNERKSGFRRHHWERAATGVWSFTLPYYWNIAPNMDATIAPHVMSKRVQLNNEFRYLNTAYGGLYPGEAVRAEFLPGDQLSDGDNRYGISLQHTQKAVNGFSGLINYNKVSDDDYYTDLSSGIASTSTTQLLQQAQLSYSGGVGGGTLQPMSSSIRPCSQMIDNPVQEQYRLLPRITVNARKPDFYY